MTTILRGDDNFDTASPIPAGNFTAKAWVNFNGSGTVAIRADGNVSSITDYGTGHYGVNYSVALTSNNAPVGNGKPSDHSGSSSQNTDVHFYSIATSSCRMILADGSTYRDSSLTQVVVVR
jgi:hypothetical protein